MLIEGEAGTVAKVISEANLTLNIANMSDEMLSAIECWSSALANNSAALANIARNARTVVRVQPKHVFIAGTYVVNQTTSST